MRIGMKKMKWVVWEMKSMNYEEILENKEP